jgi:hypothetical protein
MTAATLGWPRTVTFRETDMQTNTTTPGYDHLIAKAYSNACSWFPIS